jgi:hypothetical protein
VAAVNHVVFSRPKNVRFPSGKDFNGRSRLRIRLAGEFLRSIYAVQTRKVLGMLLGANRVLVFLRENSQPDSIRKKQVISIHDRKANLLT